MAETVPVHEGLFTTAADGTARLVAGRCRACGRHHFPRGGTCPYCSGADVEEALLSADGSLWAWTAVTAPPPGYRGEVPFGFGVVELPEGVRVITRLVESDPAALQFGQPMRLSLVPLHTDDEGRTVVTYAFGARP
jgi:uncharacterized OB-fold protein